MGIEEIVKLAGGLGMFLYGMSLMGSGLKSVAGGKLQSILEKLSNNTLKGVLLGAVVTAIIQSSSATTVMVVGFVNSGIMTLTQAIGIIMGANIGTTATGWILSLSGIEGSTWYMSLLKPSGFAPILIAIGALVFMFAKKTRRKQAASIFLGFGILMWGMHFMSEAAGVLKNSPSFTSLITLFSNPILGVIVGIVITAIIQSNSAAVGILQALALTGAITYATSIPLILGMSIGASVPVMLTAIGANKNGKRASWIYLLFNVIGVLIFMIPFYICHGIFEFEFMSVVSTPVGIAIANTIFKVFSVLVLLPFANKFAKLTTFIVRDDKKSNKLDSSDISEHLDDRFLRTPAIAISQCKEVIDHMAKLANESITLSMKQLTSYDSKECDEVIANESLADEYEDKLGTYLVKLGARQLNEAESRHVNQYLHSIGDFERLSDHAMNLIKSGEEIHDKKINFSDKGDAELENISNAIREVVANTVDAFLNDNLQAAARVEPLEQVVDGLCKKYKASHISRLQDGQCTIEVGFVYNDILNNYARISDHCSNIAVTIIRIHDKDYNTHEYLNSIKNEGNDRTFDELFSEYQKKYNL